MSLALPPWTTPIPSRTWLAWRPGLDTWIAVGAVLVMWLVHVVDNLLAPVNPVVGESILLFVGAILVGVLLPVWVVWHRMRRDLDALGLTMRRIWLAVIISLLVTVGSLPAFWSAAAAAGIDPIGQTWGQMLGMWEPLFLYGFLQLRFRDAFGEVPAPVLAGIAYGLYHVGTEPVQNSFFRMALAIVLGVAFSGTRSLWTMLPFTWAFATALIGIYDGQGFGVDAIALRVVVLVIQIGIVVMAYRRHPGDDKPDPGIRALEVAETDDRGAAELRARAERARRRSDD